MDAQLFFKTAQELILPSVYIKNDKCVKIFRLITSLILTLQGFFLGGPPHPAKILPIPPPSDTCPRFWTKACPPPSRGSSLKIWKIWIHFCVKFDYFSTLKSCISCVTLNCIRGGSMVPNIWFFGSRILTPQYFGLIIFVIA